MTGTLITATALRRTTAMLAAAVVTLAGAVPATASYSVSVQSRASAGTIYDAGTGSCGYNDGNGAGGHCSTGFAHYGGTASATVNPLGGNGSATNVSAATSGAGGGATATSRVAADLRTGSVHLYGADSNQTGNCSSALKPCGGTNSNASLTDTLHFTVLGAAANAQTAINLVFTLEGSFTNPFTENDGNAGAEIYGQLNFGHSDARFDLKSNASTGYVTKVNYLDTYPSLAPGVWTSNASLTHNVYTETYFLTGPSSDINVFLNPSMLCQAYICNFENTGKIALGLPTGVSFTSDSGVFLTGVAGGVPEPAAWALMLAGFGAVGVAARRRRTVTVAA